MPKQLLVVLDSSETSNYARDASITLALENNASLTFCITVDPDLFGEGVGLVSLAELAVTGCQNQLHEAIELTQKRGLTAVTGHILRDNPVHAAVSLTKKEQTDFIIMGLEPVVDILRPFMYNVAKEIIIETGIPLCAMRRPARPVRSHRYLVPLAYDELTDVAIERSISLAHTLGASLVFCSIESQKDSHNRQILDSAIAAANASGIKAEELLLPSVDGVPNTIANTADIAECDAIIMASHLRTGWPRFAEGSITAAVVYGSDAPVIIVSKSHGVSA